jgi:hypothetical protein
VGTTQKEGSNLMTDTTPETVVIFYEVFTGTMPDGQRVMVQIFRKKGEDRSMFAQLAFRSDNWATWSAPIRLDDMHSLTETPVA